MWIFLYILLIRLCLPSSIGLLSEISSGDASDNSTHVLDSLDHSTIRRRNSYRVSYHQCNDQQVNIMKDLWHTTTQMLLRAELSAGLVRDGRADDYHKTRFIQNFGSRRPIPGSDSVALRLKIALKDGWMGGQDEVWCQSPDELLFSCMEGDIGQLLYNGNLRRLAFPIGLVRQCSLFRNMGI